MKKWGIFLGVIMFLFFIFLGITPLKKIQCKSDECVVLEKTMLNQRPRLEKSFLKSDIADVLVENQEGTDYLVLRTKSSGDIYLKFIHTQKTMFVSKEELTRHMNIFFRKLMESNEDYESPWLRDIGSVQIYLYGEPLFE